MKLKVGISGQELTICKVRSGAQTCCGLYEENNGEMVKRGEQWITGLNGKTMGAMTQSERSVIVVCFGYMSVLL